MEATANKQSKFRERLDTAGMALSLACALHCIAMPLLIAVLPILGLSFFLDQTAEKVFAIAAVAMAACSLCWGFRVHRKIRALLLLAASAIMIISGSYFIPHSHGTEHHHGGVAHQSRPQSNPLGLVLLVAGAIGLAASHLTNRKLCKSCPDCKTHKHHS